jgi:hypothetical protein
MSRIGMKSAIARAIVDRDWRTKFVGPGADMRQAVDDAGYEITDEELSFLSCNTEESFDERFVNIENMMDFWRASEERFTKALSGRRAEAGPIPPPGSEEAVAEGL